MSPPFFAGALLGMSVALPFGPVCLLCVQRSLFLGGKIGLLSAAGAAAAHGVFAAASVAAASAAGAHLVAPSLTGATTALHLLSGSVLVALGMRTLFRRRFAPTSNPLGTRAAFGSALALAFSNPMTALPYLAVVSGSAGTLGLSFSWWSAVGASAGAATWYGGITATATFFRRSLSPRVLHSLNIVSAMLLIGFGIALACRP